MESTYVLVLAILSIQSSYLEDREIPAEGNPDTVQFWYSPGVAWRVKTYAIDHDIHIHRIGETESLDNFSPQDAAENTAEHYGDVTAKAMIIEFRDPNDAEHVEEVLSSHGLEGTLEVGKNGVAFYNPDDGHYHSQSAPK